ncbi:hypothetical protein P280DRAFT_518750 [Massarina eburnea CBS 473.64]|uniref:J domain-containing protein n=1 Tax=Massarina eburnea CBS 473.64 TaxID=1395130 RepID=A0A6A6RXP8_9PLEO|nr:hypothetical protein P280DRAFT_518750 [Massarina eburnea CBS 473.64]
MTLLQPTENHYEVLGLPPTCTPSDIRKAYQTIESSHSASKLSKPNLPSNPFRTEIITAMEAYVALIDPKSRAAYDKTLLANEERGSGQEEARKTKKPTSNNPKVLKLAEVMSEVTADMEDLAVDMIRLAGKTIKLAVNIAKLSVCVTIELVLSSLAIGTYLLRGIRGLL